MSDGHQILTTRPRSPQHWSAYTLTHIFSASLSLSLGLSLFLPLFLSFTLAGGLVGYVTYTMVGEVLPRVWDNAGGVAIACHVAFICFVMANILFNYFMCVYSGPGFVTEVHTHTKKQTHFFHAHLFNDQWTECDLIFGGEGWRHKVDTTL